MSNSNPQDAILRRQLEVPFMRQVIACAELNGWWVWHDEDSRKNKRGLCDLILVRERVVWAELKRVGGRLRPEQATFRDMMIAAGQEYYLWTPRDWDEIERALKGEAIGERAA